MSAPTVPPRPSRAQGGPTAVKQEMPLIPPRPVRKSDPSPEREAFTRSPLNFLPYTNGTAFKPPPPPGSDEKPRRPPSIAFPTKGEEGSEYSSYDQLPAAAHGVGTSAPAAPEQTKNVSADVPLHQPRASVPQSTAKSRISTVTRTDSTQAAAAGIGQARPDDDVHKGPPDSAASLSRVTSRTQDDSLRRVPSADPHPLRTEASFTRSSSSLQNGTPRPPSIHSVDHRDGIPEIGMQIPLYKNAGDVQAPSPAPSAQFQAGIGFFNDGASRPNHSRKRSSRIDFGGYGLHGDVSERQGQFEKAWHAKHPDEALKEAYSPYGLRPETALSTEQLNRIVSEEQLSGMDVSASGAPTHDLAYDANGLFAARMVTPQPASGAAKKRMSSGNQPAIESPLRKASSAFGESANTRSDKAIESEDDDATEEAAGWSIEHGEGTPILASDERVKRPSSAFLQPAVPSEDRAADDSYYDSDDVPGSRRSSLKPISRPSSRPGSVHGNWHGGPLHRFVSHEEHHGSGMGTPLEEIEEYEPLFPEEEDEKGEKKTVIKKRPGLAQHHFPSQDVWEDTPSSLQYQTYVYTPEPAPEANTAPAPAPQDVDPSKVFETPEQEEARKTKNPADMTSDSKTFTKPHFKAGVLEDFHAGGRPGVQRFPSQDIWEDTPDSFHITTTVSGPQMDEAKSPPDDRPTTAGLPGSPEDEAARSTTGFTQVLRPSVPARPERKSKLAQEIKPHEEDSRADEVPDLGTDQEQLADRTKPMIPERPKPTVPARPARPSHSDHAEGAPLAKSISTASAGSDTTPCDESATSPPVPKAKPAVPARPAGSKIAALQSGFMNDLNNRLKIGPQAPAPKPKEPEVDDMEAPKEPLADARKSRARGPARRKPAASPSAGGGEASGFSFSSPVTLWHIDENEELNVAAGEGAEVDTDTHAALEHALSENEKQNTQGGPTPLTKSSSEDATGMDDKLSANPPAAVGAEGDQVEASIPPAVMEEHKAIQPALAHALAQAEPAPANAEAEQAIEEKEMVASASQPAAQETAAASSMAEAARTTAHAGDEASTEGERIAEDGQ
ncbi:hypothetical protein LTR53_015908 [Teratosphaeriaceae sp. CCFEE 6253]|nr:hypothetical protein LTR53_015908 [Teratosphaeriaceae sp. CCFEE 6253]